MLQFARERFVGCPHPTWYSWGRRYGVHSFEVRSMRQPDAVAARVRHLRPQSLWSLLREWDLPDLRS